MTSPVLIGCLGRLEAWIAGRPVTLGGPKQRAVLSMLILRCNSTVSVDDLIEAVWGHEAALQRYTRTLQVYVANLRSVLGPTRDSLPRIVHEDAGYRLIVSAEELDWRIFTDLIGQARRLAEAGDAAGAVTRFRDAEGLWRGVAFSELGNSVVAQAEITALLEHRLAALEDRIDLELALGHHAVLVGELSGLIAEYPLRERLRAQLMLALYRSGQQAQALAAYRDVRKTLADELGIDPSTELRELEQAILRQDRSLDASSANEAAVKRWSKLPAPPNPLVGRERELAELDALIHRGVQLITLVGPGGVGKSRLAVAAAQAQVNTHHRRACFVELAALTSAEFVLPAIVGTLGLKIDVPPADLLAAACRYVAKLDLLLVLDNFEHVIDAAPIVAAFVAAAPGVTVLITSRAVLRLSAEREFPVDPLALPESSGAENLRTAAVQLFIDRARAVRSDFEATDADIDAIVKICCRLDGLPLAIELAASRSRVLTPEQLSARLGRRLQLLTGGPRDLPARQQTLQATIGWSYNLLQPDEQTLLARLAVFAGSARLEDIEAVCDINDAHGAAIPVIDGLDALLRNSLVHQRIDPLSNEPRFLLLETVQEFAWEQLAGVGEIERLRRRHGLRFADLVHRNGSGLFTDTGQRAWLDRLRLEQDNLRAALQWCTESALATAVGLQMIADLTRFWELTASVQEGSAWCDQVIAAAGTTADPALHAKGLNAAGTMAWLRGDHPQATMLHTAALKLQQAAGDRPGEAWSRICLAAQAIHQTASSDSEELSRGLAIAREICDDYLAACALLNMAIVAHYQDRTDEARSLYAEGLNLARSIGDLSLTATALADLAGLVLEENLAEATDLILEALSISTDLRIPKETLSVLLRLADVFIQADLPVVAARCLGAIHGFEQATGFTTVGYEGGHLDKTRQVAMERGGVSAAAAWVEGTRLSLDQAVEQAAAFARTRLQSAPTAA